MNLTGKEVNHSKFGVGVVTNFYPRTGRFNVKFSDGTEKPYEYPKDFKYGTLKINDPEINAQLEKDIMVTNNKAATFIKDGKQFYGLRDPKGGSDAPYKDPLKVDQLEHGVAYGRSAEEIYNALCQNSIFNWNKSKAYKFGPKARLYAEGCTETNESVWFLAYSTYNSSRNSKIGTNVVDIKTNDIEQIHDTDEFKDRLSEGSVGETQVVFVKNLAGQYEFWGVMRITGVNNEVKPFSTYSKFLSPIYRP